MFPFNLNLQGNTGSAALTIVIVLMTLLNFMMAVFWILVGWRALKAHERLPEVLSHCLRTTLSETSSEAGDAAGPGESRP